MKRYINPYKAWVGSFIPNWLLVRKEITSGAKLCYARLCQFYDQEKGCAWPSEPRLAEELGISLRMVERFVAELKSFGLIEPFQEGFNRTNRYRFPEHPWMADCHTALGGGLIPPPAADSISPSVADKENYKQENQLRESKKPPSLSPPNPRPPDRIEQSLKLLAELVSKDLLRGAPMALIVLHERHGSETVDSMIRTRANEIRGAYSPVQKLEELLRNLHTVKPHG